MAPGFVYSPCLDRKEVLPVSTLAISEVGVFYSGLSGFQVLSAREMEIRPAGRILCGCS